VKERKIERKKETETEIIWKNGTSNVLFRILDITNALYLCRATPKQKRIQGELHPKFPLRKGKNKSAGRQYNFQEARL